MSVGNAGGDGGECVATAVLLLGARGLYLGVTNTLADDQTLVVTGADVLVSLDGPLECPKA